MVSAISKPNLYTVFYGGKVTRKIILLSVINVGALKAKFLMMSHDVAKVVNSLQAGIIAISN